MRSSHPIIQHIHQAFDFRGIIEYSDRARLVGIDAARFTKLMSDPVVNPRDEELKCMAETLEVPLAWLQESDESAAAAIAPAWVKDQALSPLPTTPDSKMDLLTAWRRRLDDVWRAYLAHGNARVNKALRTMIFPHSKASKPWRLFHRSVALQSITVAFTNTEQHALATLLQVDGTPSHAEYAAWLAAQETGKAAIGLKGGPRMPAFVPPWPLKAKSKAKAEHPGEAYHLLKKRLSTARIERLKNPRCSQRTVVELLEAMMTVFEHRFPDDPEIDLWTVVRQYRAFAKVAFLSEKDLRFHPSVGTEISEVWERLPHGRLFTLDELVVRFQQLGFPERKVNRYILEAEDNGLVRRKKIQGEAWVLVFHPTERPAADATALPRRGRRRDVK